MKRTRTLIATTRIDRHGDRFTLEALKDATQQLTDRFVPMMFNHDPRVAPLGRAVGAEIERLDDGEWGLFVTFEVFEPGEVAPLSAREMVLRTLNTERLTAVFDRSHDNPADRAIFDELRSAGFDVQRDEKKALEPVSVLLVGLGAVGSMFVAGFFGKMGADAWDALKVRVSQLLEHKRKKNLEHLLIFEVQIQRGSGLLSIRAILDSPTQQLLAQFWNHGLRELEQEVRMLVPAAPDDARMFVYKYTEHGLEPSYGIRRDCMPFMFKLGGQHQRDA